MISIAGISYDEIEVARIVMEHERKYKMTREEAVSGLISIDVFNKPINAKEENCVLIKKLEALGLLKFEEKKAESLFEINATNIYWEGSKIYQNDLTKFNVKYGVVRLEEWNEGLVLWVGGQIVWESWK